MKKFLLIICSVIIFASCNKTFVVGDDLIKTQDLIDVKITDTVTLNFITQKSFPLLTTSLENLSNYAPYLFVGNLIDPIFGKTKASFMSEVRLIEYGDFGDSTVFDSVFLVLPLTFTNYRYGISDLEQLNFSVYKLNDTINNYMYNTQDPTLYYNQADLIGEGLVQTVVKPFNASNASDTTKKTDTILLYLRLSETFKQYLRTEADNLFNTPSTLFHRKFFGIYVKSNNINSGIYKIQINQNVNLEYSGIHIYYHYPSTPTKAYIFQLPITPRSGRVNIFEHDYSQAAFLSQLQDSSIIMSKAYLQGLAGTIVKIDFSNLKNMKDIIVHKAELIINVDYSSIGTFAPNPAIWFCGLDSANNIIRFSDFLTPTQYTGALYQNNSYRFIITRIVQNIIDQEYKSNFNFYLMDLNSAHSFNRVVINNALNNNSQRSKLVITYSHK